MLLRRSLVAQADYLQSIVGLFTALEQQGTREADEEADQLYRRFIEEHPNSPRGEQAEKARIAFAHRQLKSNSDGGFPSELMMHIAGALAPFNAWRARAPGHCTNPNLGCSGLDIDDPDEKYCPKSL